MDTKLNIKPEFNQLQPDILQGHIEEIKDQSIFSIKTAGEWLNIAKNQPRPSMLFDVFFFEGELCILFSDTNTGKSILAVQIADVVSRGRPVFPFKMDAETQKVLYADFELSAKQFETRYSKNYLNHYQFSENFLRLEINPDCDLPTGQNFEQLVFSHLEKTILETGTKILIVDNLTYLKSGTETAKDALPLMKQLKELKRKFNLSILALAHTPKRDLSKPITRNDLQGSKMLINFCDSSFTIGESTRDKNCRYLKQIKARNTEIIYDTNNVVLCQVCKPDNFLMFEFTGYGTEKEHLKTITDREERKEKAKELHEAGKSLRDIAIELGISHQQVKRYLS